MTATPPTKITFGNRRAGVLAHVKQAKRLDLIAEGLPIIAASAHSFWDAALRLELGSRERNVLEGFAEEEATKILILIDMVRCPAKVVATRAGAIMKTFYDHLGRMIYAEAQHWSASDIAELRGYVDEERKGHYLEGYVGEYIVPNAMRYRREARMYADIEVYENEEPQWSAPRGDGGTKGLFGGPPPFLALIDAMELLGMFSRPGVQIIHDVWDAVEFGDDAHVDDSDRLKRTMLERLLQAKLIPEEAEDEHVRQIYRSWQMPMYALEFSEVAVPLEELEAQREAALWNEYGV